MRLKAADAADLDSWWDGEPFEAVLADVPCTASGIARRHPDIRWLRRDIKSVALLPQVLAVAADITTPDGRAGVLAAAISAAREEDLLRADHFLHLRCEVPMPDVVAEAKELIDRPDVRLMSLMDHTPGQRQFRDEVKLRDYYRGKGGGMTDAQLDVLFARRFAYQKEYAVANTRAIVALAHEYRIPLASHDDTTDENVVDAVNDKVAVEIGRAHV